MNSDKMAPRQGPKGKTLERRIDELLSWATWRNVLILWVLLVLFNLLVIGPAYRRIETFSAGTGAIDFLIMYRPDRAYDMIASYGEQGRRYYATVALTLDTVLPVLLAAAFGLALGRVFRQAFSRRGVLYRALFVPAAAMVADLLENAGITTMLLSYPTRLPVIALLTSSFSTVKWTAVAAESLLLVIGLMAWMVQTVRGKTTVDRDAQDGEEP